jgi:hypothetical protein
LRFTQAKIERCHLTSICNRPTTRAPTDRSIPERLAYAAPTACHTDTCSGQQRGAGSLCRNPTPSGHVLDGTLQLWANRLQPCPKEEPSTAPGDAASPWRFRPRARLFDPTSDTPCHTPQNPVTRILQSIQSPSRRPFVKKGDFPSPECLPSTSAPEGTRHRVRGLATGEPASSALSPHECLRTARLDSRAYPRILHPQGREPRAACQLLQPKRPATTTAGTVEPRAPRLWCDPYALRCLGG